MGMDPASASSVAARARTENFPVASLLFPRPLRPHLRAIYGFARLVDILGDEYEGDRLEAWTSWRPRSTRATKGSRRGR
jgi:phytoene/squalene synthetase